MKNKDSRIEYVSDGHVRAKPLGEFRRKMLEDAIRAEKQDKEEVQIRNFQTYYEDIYLPLHSKTMTRLLHLLGVLLTLAFVVYVCVSQPLYWLLLAPFVVYPLAWISHLVFERNKPAAWTNPLYAKLADLRMCWEIVTGKI